MRERRPSGPSNVRLEQVLVGAVRPNPFQPRHHWDDHELSELVESIRSHGLLQPLLVREAQTGFEIVAGERRWRAAQLAGLERVPVLVRNCSDEEAATWALVENNERVGLHLRDEIEAYRVLMRRFGLTESALAQRLGRSQSAISNRLRLASLDDAIWQIAADGQLSERHLRALLALPETERVGFAVRAVAGGWTVRRLEEEINKVSALGEVPAKRKRVVRIFKDMRIFLNSFRSAVTMLQEAGVAAELEEHEDEAFFEVRVRIPKSEGKVVHHG